LDELKELVHNQLKECIKAQDEEKGIYDLETIRATLYSYNNILKKIDHIAKMLKTDNVHLLHNSNIANMQDIKVKGGVGYIDELEKTEEMKEKLKAKYFRYYQLVERLDFSMDFLDDIEQAIIQSVLIEHKEIKEVSKVLNVKDVNTVLNKALIKLRTYLTLC